ncbi:ATP-binding protein [uncultured Fusobacterium sp.]|uniref:ATP-binding protein n=1 Tax=uncultured Fusobacterium sp. TaxID=159267 RepID=UPI0015A66178|nr:ATP-binding protein [uncultured Fusobacterium sp.]
MIDKEKQNIEWKETWKEDYLKWICGFANAQGGKIYIGKNDDGTVTGIINAKKLLEDIPNKVRDVLGIIVDVNLYSEENKDYLEIVTLPSSYPVNYKGEYHYRSGSTKQLLKGTALTQFLFEKTGITWDSIPLDNLSTDDFWRDSFDIFRKQAILSKRMDEKDLNMTNEQLLDSLGLIKDGKILRAGMMLFHQNPEKWINGSYIKIGYFERDSEISYMDEIHGSLISQADKVIDLIFTKYLKADISYEGVTRVETYPFPKAAIREAVYNAIVHKNYATQIPIQISIYKDKLYISNDCILPSGWTVETLMGKHRSKPFNPNIANGFFRAGFIETWGRGIEKICEACKNYGTTLPEYTVYPEDIMIRFEALNTDTNTDTNTDMNTDIDFKVEKLLEYLKLNPRVTQKGLAEYFNVTKRTIERNMNILKKEKLIERVGNNRSGYWKILK